MNLYLDDNLADPRLLNILQRAGHDVVRPKDVGLLGATDTRHFEYAIRHQRPIVTKDREDYWELHSLLMTAQGNHPGIFSVREDGDPRKDMKAKDIMQAVNRLGQSNVGLVNQIVILNQWR